MKELDWAIKKNDVERIVFLLQQGVDCEGAVLLHLKDILVPKYFNEADLRARGAILDLNDLDAAFKKYNHTSSSSGPINTQRIDMYIKRLYTSTLQALEMWQTGKLANPEVENSWNLDSISYLASQWIEGSLPSFLQEYVQQTEERYTEHKYVAWDNESLEEAEEKTLDEVIVHALRTHWHLVADQADIVSVQIRNNVIDGAMELCASNEDPAFTKAVLAFIRDKVLEQVFNGSINEESIKTALEAEKDSLLKGKLVANQASYYEKATVNLFEKWQKGTLESHTLMDVVAYFKKQFQHYELPGQLKQVLLDKAIPQLLKQYRTKKELSDKLMERLTSQFKANVLGHYEKGAVKDTPYREELSQVIFLKLLADWKTQKLSAEASQYLQAHLLSGLQETLQEFGMPTSRYTLYLMMSRQHDEITLLRDENASLREMLSVFQQEVNAMRQEFAEVRAAMPSAPVLGNHQNDNNAPMPGNNNNDNHAPVPQNNNTKESDATLAQARGMFRSAPTPSTLSTPDWSVLPKFGSK